MESFYSTKAKVSACVPKLFLFELQFKQKFPSSFNILIWLDQQNPEPEGL